MQWMRCHLSPESANEPLCVWSCIIEGERGTGVIGLNGAAARKGQVGDELIIMTFISLPLSEAKAFKPINLFPDRNNKLV